ncbi:LemA family protein [Marinicella rhabdoformis]|uniref:LemA family protein n=1 Tax=Marinicella rhabdoformis TaxID=2580566 RepID=UPI001FECC7B9|nr:LemA family protein [Marinicella rhabdoformis]
MEDAWSGIEVQLKRRFDLIPQLASVVKQYNQHEADTLERIVSLRQKGSPKSKQEQQQNEQELSQYLRRFFVHVEAYPDLKSNQNYLELQKQLGQIEHDIQLARRYFNGTVRMYNNLIQSFPSIFVARQFNFVEAEYFELENPTEAESPKI